MSATLSASIAEEKVVRDFVSCLKNEWGARNFFATQRQVSLQKELGENRKSVDGLGQPVAEIDNEVYVLAEQRYGRGCWKDAGFKRWFFDRHPALKVKSSGTRIQSGYGGLSSGCKKKFSKSYG